jgi:long-chain acyl-CoA synthetase
MPQPATSSDDPRSTVPGRVEPILRKVDGVVVEACVPPLVPPREGGSLADIPFGNAAEAPDDVVLARKGPDGSWADVSAAEFARQVTRAAKGLIALGLEPGDRLAIMSRTTYEWTLLDFAAWAAGLVTVPVFPTSSASQTRHLLHDAGARACAVEDVELARLVSGVREELPGLEHLWQLDTGAVGRLEAAGRELPDETVDARRALLSPDSVATLIYTSGTTGRPKGCVLTHGNFLAEVDNAVALLFPVFTSAREDVPASTLLFLPLSHVFGRMVAIGCQRARVRLGHAPSTRTEDLLADLSSFRPSFLPAIPHVLERVFHTARATAERMRRGSSFDRAERVAVRWGDAAEQARHGGGRGPGLGVRAARSVYDTLVYRRIRAALGGNVRHVICGGSPLNRRMGAFFAGAGIEILEGYGLTETTAAATVTPPWKPRLGTVGRPLPGTSVRIAGDGEVLLKGAQVFAGYWDVTRARVLPELVGGGWFPTGDVGALDEDGHLTITGRKKDILVTSSGKNIAPAPLENWLRAHPLVSQCLVVGDARPHLTALVTLAHEGLAHWRRMHGKEDVPITELVHDEDLRRNLRQAVDDANRLVSRAEGIRDFTVLPGDFTEEGGHLSPSMKVKRHVVVREFAAEIDALYTGE